MAAGSRAAKSFVKETRKAVDRVKKAKPKAKKEPRPTWAKDMSEEEFLDLIGSPRRGKAGEINPEVKVQRKSGGLADPYAAIERGNRMSEMEAGASKAMEKKKGLKSVPADNKGLKKLPPKVRNKMGYKKAGGYMKKKGYKSGGSISKPRGVGCAMRGYGKAMKG